jgi:hypothetical protein
MRQQPGLTNQDRFLSVTGLSFDIAVWEVFLPLTVGAQLVVGSHEVIIDGARLLDRLATSGATAMQATPTTWRLLLESGWQGSNHLTSMCGLEGAVNTVEPGGFIFVGDVRSLPLLEAFHTSIQLYQAPSSLLNSELQQRVQRCMIEEKELVIDPSFFTALKQHLSKIGQVQIQLKRGRHHNELTRFRYDVILRIGPENHPAVDHPWLDLQKQGLTLPTIRRLLIETEPEILGIARVPNARLLAEVKTLEWLSSRERFETVGELREALQERVPETGVDPEDVWVLVIVWK